MIIVLFWFMLTGMAVTVDVMRKAVDTPPVAGTTVTVKMGV